MALNWRDATTLELNDGAIPDPNFPGQSLRLLHNVRVAVEGGFLHIDPRQQQSEAGAGQEFDVFIVPASAVKAAVYRDVKRRGNLASF
ncbi:hypothetical protein [Streptomyces sp. SP18CM02]|uniref:hypothetical protein n=1 Tax=Streptomyces sp. SP18CM02 TaxID=2758571 RepID=UPI00168B9F32|nr:hypothetical protein [Streptomyces sp. SP18CM02]MBD3550838.1 hypothetical protein [Streptomyces sp. SP18CM02]